MKFNVQSKTLHQQLQVLSKVIKELEEAPIREKIGGKLDTAELDTEMETLRKQLRQLSEFENE